MEVSLSLLHWQFTWLNPANRSEVNKIINIVHRRKYTYYETQLVMLKSNVPNRSINMLFSPHLRSAGSFSKPDSSSHWRCDHMYSNFVFLGLWPSYEARHMCIPLLYPIIPQQEYVTTKERRKFSALILKEANQYTNKNSKTCPKYILAK